MTFTLGTHNLEDENGSPSFFADVVIFTEAVPRRIRDQLRALRAGHRLVVCHQQPDLCVSLSRRLVKVKGTSYNRYVDGVPHVTPNRGTFVVFGELRGTRQPVAVVAEHRINAAFPPYIRGEGAFRKRAWLRHTAASIDTALRLRDSGYRVLAGGDLNTPSGDGEAPFELGYRGRLREVGRGFDRLASTSRLTNARLLSRKGSDHPRLRATVQEAA